MVCLGNICRSPIAEGVLQYKVDKKGLNWHVDSAGTESYHIGEAPHPYSQKICLQHGIDVSLQRARKFVKEDFERYDRIYALATDVSEQIKRIAGNKTDISKLSLFLNELHPGSNASVPDPWYGNEDGYLPVYKMIDEVCDAIIEKYQ
jgi:protein-tyrosine phosphatase